MVKASYKGGLSRTVVASSKVQSTQSSWKLTKVLERVEDSLSRELKHTPDHNDGEPRVKIPLSALLTAAFIVLAPSIYALITYQQSYSFLWTRYFAFPIVLTEIGVIALALIAGVKPISSFTSLPLTTRLVCFVFVTSISVSTYNASGVPFMAFVHFTITLLHCAVAYILFEALRGPWANLQRMILWSVALGIALFAMTAYAVLFASRDISDFNWTNVGTGISNVRHFAYLAIVGASMSAGLFVTARASKTRLVSWVCLTVSMALLFWSGGRGGITALAVILLAVLPFVQRARMFREISFLAVSLLGAIAISVIWIPDHPAWGVSHLFYKTVNGSGTVLEFTSNRTLFWRSAWEGFLQNPLFGYGEGQFRSLSEVAGGNYNHPHNAVLQALYQWGMVGSLAIMALHVRALILLPEALKKLPAVAVPASTGLIGFVTLSMVDGPFFYVLPTFLWAIMLATLASAQTKPHNNSLAHTGPN